MTTGEKIAVGDAGFLRGHGTHVASGDTELTATVTGFVERVNKLVSVRPLNGRYPSFNDFPHPKHKARFATFLPVIKAKWAM